MGSSMNCSIINGNTTGVRPSVVVIFGATGDLAQRKLVPAVFELLASGIRAPEDLHLVSFARREFSSEAFNDVLRGSLEHYLPKDTCDDQLWGQLRERSVYVRGDFDDPEAYRRLKVQLEEIDRLTGVRCERAYYLATSPEFFPVVATQLFSAGLVGFGQEFDRERLVVEKPFGVDRRSARELNDLLGKCLPERQIYRIDHYLAKEAVQNIIAFRFANGVFEPLWRRDFIDHIEVSVCETLGVGTRAGYFDHSGIVRDLIQNHALQVLALILMEPPVAFEADAIHDEKVKVLRSLSLCRQTPGRPECIVQPSDCVEQYTVRGRYGQGVVADDFVKAYLDETGVDPSSTTETYAAMRLEVDNWRWGGMPVFLRAGKRLAKRVTEVKIVFRQAPFSLLARRTPGADVKALSSVQNVLTLKIQPDEGINLQFNSKVPGLSMLLQQVSMDFAYGQSFSSKLPDAYERLLIDCLKADTTLFTRSDEIEYAWGVVDPILEAWKTDPRRYPLHEYVPGSWGPDHADGLLHQSGIQGWA